MTVKNTLLLIPLRIFPLALHALVPLFLLLFEAIVQVLSLGVFRYTVVADWMS